MKMILNSNLIKNFSAVLGENEKGNVYMSLVYATYDKDKKEYVRQVQGFIPKFDIKKVVSVLQLYPRNYDDRSQFNELLSKC